MFRVIGGAVVYGFAVFGVVRFFDRPRLAVVFKGGDVKLPDAPVQQDSGAPERGEDGVPA